MILEDFSGLAPIPGRPDLRTIRARFGRLAATGFLRHGLPASQGGHGNGFGDLLESHRRLGTLTHDPGLILMANAHLWGAVFPLQRHGTEAQQSRFLSQLLAGNWLAGHAITEPACGSDLQAMQCRAEQVPEGFRLIGEKRYISNAPLADWLIVYARLEGCITAFLVNREDVGCRFTEDHGLRACRGSSTGGVMLESCLIGTDRLLGKPGAGERILQQALDFERAFIFAGIAGVMAWQLDRAIAHSRQRQSRGAPLGHHQAIAHAIAAMKLRLDTLDLWLRECAHLADAGQRLTLTAAQTKLHGAEAFLQSSLDAVQICGASGLEADPGLADLVQDAMASRLFSGSSEVQKNIIAALLGTGEGFRGTPGKVPEAP